MEDKEAKRRSTVLSWVKDVHKSLEWNEEGVATTMRLFDAQIAKHPEDYPPDKYQELAAVMMAITAKANGDPVSMQQMAEYTADYMTTDELITAERVILRRIIDDASICTLVPEAGNDKSDRRTA